MKDIEGTPLSNFAELLANTSKSAVTMRTRCVVNIPATKPLSVSCHCTCNKTIWKVYQKLPTYYIKFY